MNRNLVRDLHDAWSQAPKGDIVVWVHLFGIDHAEELQGVNLQVLAETAGIPRTYATEIHKGMPTRRSRAPEVIRALVEEGTLWPRSIGIVNLRST
jgi:hypothetical protein